MTMSNQQFPKKKSLKPDGYPGEFHPNLKESIQSLKKSTKKQKKNISKVV